MAQHLRAAYEARSRQVIDARLSLAEAVAGLRAELEARRSECDELRQLVNETRATNARLGEQLGQAEARGAALASELATTNEHLAALQASKAIRLSAPLRRLVHRLKALR